MSSLSAPAPRGIRMHPADNVAIVVNDGGLKPGAALADGPVLVEAVPQGHKVALVDLPAGTAVRRYNVVIGHTGVAIPAGGWVNEQRLVMPAARSLEGLPASNPPAELPPLTGYTFQGYRNTDGSVGTRNLLAITTTVQCVAGVLDFAVERIRTELLPLYPNVDGVVGLEHTYGCGVAIDAPDAVIPIRTLRHISLNPNFGGEVMVVSLGCEKLQPERLFPPNAIPIQDTRGTGFAGPQGASPSRRRRERGKPRSGAGGAGCYFAWKTVRSVCTSASGKRRPARWSSMQRSTSGLRWRSALARTSSGVIHSVRTMPVSSGRALSKSPSVPQ